MSLKSVSSPDFELISCITKTPSLTEHKASLKGVARGVSRGSQSGGPNVSGPSVRTIDFTGA